MTTLVVLDGYTLNPGDNPWDDLARLGRLEVYDRTPAAEVVARARAADLVLTNKTRLTASVLEALPRLRYIGVLATGFDVVDVVAARRRGIAVTNIPEYGTASVAQHVFALLLELAHQTGRHARAVAAGEWTRSADFSFWKAPPLELEGSTLGIVGFGRIGRRVAAIGRAFGMRVIVSSRSGPSSDVEDVEWRTTAQVFAEADVVSLHCPATPETTGLVNAALLSTMKPGALFLNVARGSLVDEQALARALRDGSLAGAAVDVVSQEPIRADNPLLAAPNCLITPHMAWASRTARRRLLEIAVGNVEAFLSGSPRNVVN